MHNFLIPITPSPDVYRDWQGDSESHQKDTYTIVICLAAVGADRSKPIWAIYAVYNNGTDSYTRWAKDLTTGLASNEFKYIASNWDDYDFDDIP